MTTTVNVLILSAGRRVELVRAFQRQHPGLDVTPRVVAADASPLAPALYFADAHEILPRCTESNYIQALLALCRKHAIDLVIPTIDTELAVMAANRELIEETTGALVAISDTYSIAICRDKVKTHAYLRSKGLVTPHLYTEDEVTGLRVTFPAFAKPRGGSSSVGAQRLDTLDDLEVARRTTPDLMVQSYAAGDEYTVDCFIAPDGRPLSITPRLRLATRSGEISKGRIHHAPEVIEATERLLAALPLRYHVTVQCIVENGTVSFIEINPRFGGGAPMSIHAGADSCLNLYRIRLNIPTTPTPAMDGATFLRFDRTLQLGTTTEPQAVLFE
ncbi:ATP-grasp domain-containing protein [Oceanitalea stevensii]|uniref:ATP-grasp domain-containing protein n=1 Tax=Oceanitalea stevensii TaxID=2763072 RepID=A0ABR8Z563_9MICO|nr:ATP-grasp domain-containing protein [Oceanitalea stevensii]MBD8063390.1 ATP-grasp domain-containing protein [Oceanitalea stevensii]